MDVESARRSVTILTVTSATEDPVVRAKALTSRDVWAIIVAAVVTLAVLAPALLPHGAGLTPDSATYGAAARSLAHARGYLDLDGVSPMLDFPPLYPVLLAPWLPAGLSVGAAGGVVGVLCAVCLAGLMVAWGRQLGLPTAAALVVAVVATTLPPVVDSSSAVLSEGPFIALWTAVGLVLTGLVVAEQVARWQLVVLTVLLAAACLTRYLGLALVAGACLALLLRPGPRRPRLLSTGAVTLGAVTPLGLWLTRNKIVGGSFTAPDYGKTKTSILGHLHDDLAGVGGWFVGDGSDVLAVLVGIAVLAIPLAVAFLGLRWCDRSRPDVRAMGLVCVVYLALLLVGQSLVGLDTDDRFVRPLAPTLLLLAAVLVCRSAPSHDRRAGAALLIVGGLVALHTIPADRQRIADGHGAGLADYNASRWQHSALLAALRAHPPGRILVSNDAFAVSLLARMPVEQSPATVYDNSNQPTGDLGQFQNDVQDQPRTLAWFDNPDVGQLVPLKDLGRAVCLEQVARFADGLLLQTCGSVPKP